jgi:ubiquinone/menaquinone biosynthesis C-methylase UbiE
MRVESNQLKVEQSRRGWDEAAIKDAMGYISPYGQDWDFEKFFSFKAQLASEYTRDLFTEMGFDPTDKRMIDIGCGIGGMTRYFSGLFAEAHGVDFSKELIKKAIDLNADKENVLFRANNGIDLSIYQDNFFDFCFSFATFQFLPAVTYLGNYFGEIVRVLRPGGLFKIHMDGRKWVRPRIPRLSKPGKNVFCPIPIWRPLYNFLRYNRLFRIYGRLAVDSITLKAYSHGIIVSWKTARDILDSLPVEFQILGKDSARMWIQGCKVQKI